MQLRLLAMAAAAAGALTVGLAATPAAGAAGDFLGGCNLTDVTPNAGACDGFYEGNMLNNSPPDVVIQTAALAALGLTWDGTLEEAQLNLNSPTINFATLLSGTTYIGIHWGGGQGPLGDVQGGVTGFYRLDLAADAELDVILSAFGSQSGARLYLTQPCVGDCGGGGGNEIPEPGTWALMILGFGATGAMLRQRRRQFA